ncbi:hypothetical protein A1O1_02259 [Capronia coronata CBS 617.96]|uniref:Uncharacterized protein n=1 Tax=Capronia coronata CBS 617.96 TaxID=1182541 RepID=W9YX91_9EURO|nr:uncharacterized protein A1O1_02259 [Capronia coronata CBS 617.96]EXJ93866.1 hypothetical protein A1O1_02259 [Capronia coronata CBS 617.96]
MAHAARGAAALAASDGPAALSAYTQALIEHPNSPDYYVQRSTAFTRIKPPRYDLALKDAEYAVALGYKRAVREKIQAGQQRRVVALYGLGRYADAKYLLTTMVRWRPHDSKTAKMEGDMWMARVESKLKQVPDSEKVVTIKERPEIEVLPEDKLRQLFKAQLNMDGSYKLDDSTSLKSTTTPTTNTNGTTTTMTASDNSAATTAMPSASAAGSAAADVPKIRHEWYQNAQSVTLTLYAKGVPKDTAEIEIKEDSVYISFPHPANPSATFTFSLDPLFALIDPSQSKFSIMSTKIELTLKKLQPGQKWHNLEGTTPLQPSTQNENVTQNDVSVSSAKAPPLVSTLPTTQSTSAATVPAYPTSSRHGPKDWDKLANELHSQSKSKKTKKSQSKSDKADSVSKPAAEADINANDSPPGSGDEAGDDVDSDYETGDAVDGFFKKLYAGADPDTRRAMMKSFYESKGTALSTNWSEVGKAPVKEVNSKNDE